MRTIKFRAWDKINKQMSIVREIDWAPQGYAPFITDIALKPLSDKGIDELRKAGKNPNYYEAYPDDCELMQFTGLADKNGKEIYEGDIVTNFENNPQVVRYEDVGFAPFYDQEASDYIYHGSSLSEIEVIGNIYQNKELLTT